jgi:hypothetical protein
MQECLAENPGEVFMIISRRLVYVLSVLVLALSCSPDESDDQIPFVPFPDIVINLGLPEYFPLQSAGNSKILNEGGVKGIILYHNTNGNYYAFERNCSYHPNDACSTVGIDATGFRLTDSCCGSYFDFEGNPISGPAWRPLRRYVTTLVASQLTITDEIVE